MTIYEVSLQKTLTSGNDAGKKWSNVYHISEGSLAAATLHAPDIVDLEKTIYPDNVAIVRWSVRDPGVRGSGQSHEIHVDGTRGVGTPDTQLPLFVAVLFQFAVAVGRPSAKYLRLPLDESEVTGGLVDSALTDALSTSWAVPLVALGFVTDESGNALTGYGFRHAATSRQTGWHRRKRVGFKRGWVAV